MPQVWLSSLSAAFDRCIAFLTACVVVAAAVKYLSHSASFDCTERAVPSIHGASHLVSTLPYAKPGRDPERVLTRAAGYAAAPERFIQKAIGWWLRELSRHDGPRAACFLQVHWHQLQTVARKEGSSRLDPESARRLLDFLGRKDQTGAPL